MSLLLDGVDDAAVVACPTQSGNLVTLSCWVKVVSHAVIRIPFLLCETDGTFTNSTYIQLIAAGNAQAQTRTTSNANAQTAAAIATGSWVHLCAVFATAADRRIFVNGGSKVVNTTSRSILGILDNLVIGRRSDNSTFMVDRVAECAVFNYAMSDADVATLAGGTSPMDLTTAPVRYYRLKTDTLDTVTGANGLTVTGATIDGDHPAVSDPGGGGAALTATPADALGITDSVSISIGRAVAVDDTLGVTDSPSAAIIKLQQIDDALGIVDQVAPASGVAVAVSDAIGITDQATPAASTVKSVADSLAIADAQAFDIGLRVADVLGIADSAAAAIIKVQQVDDALGITDSQAIARTLGRQVDDNLAITDQLATVSAFLRTVSDQLGVSDAVFPASAVFRAVDDALGVSDQVVPAAGYAQMVSDALGITDLVSRRRDFAVIVDDLLVIADAADVLWVPGAVTYALLELVDRLATVLAIEDRPALNLELGDTAA